MSGTIYVGPSPGDGSSMFAETSRNLQHSMRLTPESRSYTLIYEGKSISKLQMDIELKQIRVLIRKILLFLNINSLYIEALVPSFHKPLKTSSIKFFGLLSEPGGDFPLYSFIVGKMFS
jgi:hypothetical protein